MDIYAIISISISLLAIVASIIVTFASWTGKDLITQTRNDIKAVDSRATEDIKAVEKRAEERDCERKEEINKLEKKVELQDLRLREFESEKFQKLIDLVNNIDKKVETIKTEITYIKDNRK